MFAQTPAGVRLFALAPAPSNGAIVTVRRSVATWAGCNECRKNSGDNACVAWVHCDAQSVPNPRSTMLDLSYQ